MLIMPQYAAQMAAQVAEMKPYVLEGKQLTWADLFRMRRPTAIDENGIANVHLYGLMGAKWDGIYKLLGIVTDYDDLAQELNALATDKRVIGIFLDNESGGGKALGAPEMADVVTAVAGIKPILSYTDTYSASACYYLGCGASAFYASRSAIVGSIGTRVDWLTWAGYLEKLGIKPVELTSTGSTLKGVGSPHREPTAEELAFIQANMDATNAAFISHVKAARPGIDEEVFKAGFYSGEKAIELGLIDALATRQEAYEDLLALAKS